MSKLYRVPLLALPFMLLVACHDEGPAERAGKSMDQIGEKLRDAVDPPGPVEKVGRALDRATR